MADDIQADSASCADSEDGSITINLAGGTAPYSYDFSDGSSEHPATLGAGIYAVTITDVDGCFGIV